VIDSQEKAGGGRVSKMTLPFVLVSSAKIDPAAHVAAKLSDWVRNRRFETGIGF
jgi:hypothetical protein